MSTKTLKIKPLVIAVVGPTSIGKSDYAVTLAKKIGGEIISADSRQVYRGLDIGSGKITKKEMDGIQHYMLDVASPKKVFSVHDFKKKALPILLNIVARGKTPIIVGGTGFYVDALVGENVIPEVPPNKKLRKKFLAQSAEVNFKHLQKLDPKRAKTIDKHNNVRLVRAIEIATALGSVPKQKKVALPYRVLWMGLTADRDILRKRIEKRLRARLLQGMLGEVKKLRAEGVSWKRLHDLGLEYRYVALHLQGKLKIEDLEKTLADKIYQYAMRQLRWFKRNKEINWIDAKQMSKMAGPEVMKFLK